METNLIKILAIDDSADNLVTIKALLNESFHEARILTAMTGLMGIELAIAEDPDVILLDIVMPMMDGFETCKRLKKLDKTKDIPIVFVTAIQDDPHSRVLALESGGDAFLAKPIDESELIAQVRAMIIIKAAIQSKKTETERLTKMVEKQTAEINDMYSKTLVLYNDLEKKNNLQIQQHNELIEAKQRFNMLLKASLDSQKDMIILAIDKNYNYLFFNQAHKDEMKYAYNLDVTIGSNLIETIAYETDKVNSKRNYDLAMTGVSHSTIQKYGDLNVSYYETFYNPIYDEKRNIIGATAFARNITDRMMAENQLNEAKVKLEIALESSEMGSWQLDIQKNERFFDSQSCVLLGIDPQTFNGTSKEFFSIIQADDRKIVKNALKNTLNRHKPYEPEYRVIHPDGSVHYISAKGKLMLDTQGNPKMITGFIWDDTEKKLQQNELREAKNRFEMLFSTSPDASIITKLSNGLIVAVNEGFTNISGYSRNEALAKSVLELNLYHDPNGRKVIVDVLKRQGSIQNKEVVFKRKDDTLFPGLMSSNLITLGGSPHVFSTIRDITTFKEVENALRESNEKYRLLYSSMNQGLALHEIITDNQNNPVDYRFLSINDSFERLTGLKSEEVVGKTILELLPRTEDYWIKAFGRVALTRIPEQFENYASELGRYFSVTAYSPMPRQFAVLMNDITDRKNKEEKILYINDHDFLTDLYNRRYYVESFDRLNTPNNLPLGIMMLDVNGLKIINDAYGHGVGDQALKSVATVLNQTFEAKDIVARIGGDEFAILLPNTSLEKMQMYKEALKLNVSQKPIMNVILSLATGYEIVTVSNKTLDEMLIMAENHMYRHKLTEGVGVRNRAIQAILNTLTEKYEPERIHSERVSAYCRQIGEALHFRQDDLNELSMAGMYHDIGKISILDSILEKPGKLTPEEYEIIKTHTETGYQILRAADQYSDLAIHALSHHEHFNGKGYPRGLKGEQIPLYSRIIGIADAFEAMTAERPYRKAMSMENAKLELSRYAGSQFDPEIVKVFLEQVLS